MERSTRKSFKILAVGSSLRRRVALSLAVVRVVLLPVIFLGLFYLLKMGIIVDRIVNSDAPVARLAEQSSVAMLEARRAERNYFLLHDAAYLKSNAEAVARLRQLLLEIRDLDSKQRAGVQEALEDAAVYERQFDAAASLSGPREHTPLQQVQGVVRTYETNLNDLLRRGRHETRVQLVEEVHGWADAFDAELAKTVEAGDPGLRQVTKDLQASSEKVLRRSSNLETTSWTRIQQDHEEAQNIMHRAKWMLSLVSAVTLVLSVWISFVLPRRAIQPLINLREAVDHAAAGNYEIDFDVQGEGEVVDLANSVRNLILHAQQRAGHVHA